VSKILISSILWRKVNQATLDTLRGESGGQYHITLTAEKKIAEFFDGLEQSDPTDKGGYTLKVPLLAYDGESPIDAMTLDVRFMGDMSARKDWNIPSQRPETAYPLWRLGRTLPTGKSTIDSGDQYIILLARDTKGKYHARMVDLAVTPKIPEEFVQMMKASDFGIWKSETPSSSLQPQSVQIASLLKEHHNVLIFGPPGTGKSHVMRQVSDVFQNGHIWLETTNESDPLSGEGPTKTKDQWITFHQSYSYEDFIIGLRPNLNDESEKLLNLEPVPGALLELSEFAKQPESTSLLLIDEINRGNVSRIFGEFITLLEADKRLDPDGKITDRTVSLRLPYLPTNGAVEVKFDSGTVTVSNPYDLSYHLYTLASMNSVDKSIAPLDSALRRRFHIVNLEPRLDEMARLMGIEEAFCSDNRVLPAKLNEVRHIQLLALSLFEAINEKIGQFLGTEFMLGQWYLSALVSPDTFEDASEGLTSLWNNKVWPQLEDLFHGRIEQLFSIIGLPETLNKNQGPLTASIPETSLVDLGAQPYIGVQRCSFEKLVEFITSIAHVVVEQPEAEAPNTGGGQVSEETP
jgi:5-methylcytosine-specific restriction enzyme B